MVFKNTTIRRENNVIGALGTDTYYYALLMGLKNKNSFEIISELRCTSKFTKQGWGCRKNTRHAMVAGNDVLLPYYPRGWPSAKKGGRSVSVYLYWFAFVGTGSSSGMCAIQNKENRAG